MKKKRKKTYTQCEGGILHRLAAYIHESTIYENKPTEKGRISSLKKLDSMKSILEDSKPVDGWKPTGAMKSMRNYALRFSKRVGLL